MKRLLGILAVFAVLIGVAAGVAAADETYTTITVLQDDSNVEEFRQTGNVTANAEGVMATVTVAESHDGVGLDGVHADAGYVYFNIDYDGEIPRKFRVKVPDAYFEGRPATIDAENVDEQATIQPVSDKSYTVVEIHVDGETDATFQLSKAVGWYFDGKDRVSRIVNETTGWEPPSLFGSTSWTYVDGAKWANDTYTIDSGAKASNVVVQYDDAAGPSESWIEVHSCDEVDAADVCRYTTDNSTVRLHSTLDEKPTVRHRTGGGPVESVKAAVEEALQAPKRILDDLRDSIPFL